EHHHEHEGGDQGADDDGGGRPERASRGIGPRSTPVVAAAVHHTSSAARRCGMPCIGCWPGTLEPGSTLSVERGGTWFGDSPPAETCAARHRRCRRAGCANGPHRNPGAARRNGRSVDQSQSEPTDLLPLASSQHVDQSQSEPTDLLPLASSQYVDQSSSSCFSTTRVSVVSTRPAIEAALRSALRATLTGSMMPASTRSTYSPVAAFRPCPTCASLTRSTTTQPSSPAFSAIQRSGSTAARTTARAPTASSPVRPREPSRPSAAWTWALPPPATMPASMAARVAETASSIRIFFSLSSTSVCAPTLITDTPPASFARRSCSFSRSQSESVLAISARICATRSLTAWSSPAPPTMVVESLVMTTRPA